MDINQRGTNGPLVPQIRARMRKVREELRFSWNEMADAFDFSSTFVHGLARDDLPKRVRSKHVEKIIRDLEALEVRAGFRDVSSASAIPAQPRELGVSDMPLEDLIRAINAKGFSVTFSPALRS